MSTPEPKAIIFLTFANDHGDGNRYLRNLAQEARELREALAPLEGDGLCTVEVRQNVTIAEVIDRFQNRIFRNRVAIYHFGGHSDSLQLLLETSDGQAAPVNARELAAFLGQQSGIKLVFLNACSNQAHVQGLLDAGVDAVIATRQDIDDVVATHFAERFYKGLAGGATLQTAFNEAVETTKIERGNQPRHLYLLQPDGTRAEIDEWPWSLSLRVGAEDAANWKVSDSPRPAGSDANDEVESDPQRLIVPRLDDITGRQHGELADALVAAFGDKETLRRMVAVELDKNLDAIAGGSTLTATAFDLVGWAQRSGYLRELIQGALDTLPRNAKLRAFALSLGARTHVRTAGQRSDKPSALAEVTPQPVRPTTLSGHDLFLAYSRKDSNLMQRLRRDLLAAGIVAWIDQEALEPGSPVWQRGVEAAIRGSRGVLVILSPDAKESDWVHIEISLARRIGRRIFPVLAGGDEDNAVPFVLETTHRVDVRSDYAEGVHNRLIPALRRHLGLSKSGEPKPSQKQDDAPKSESVPPIADAKRVIMKPPLDIEWVTIAAGEILMGSDESKDEMAFDDEMPQHRLHLPAYQIARHPITNAQYQVYVEATGRRAPEDWKNGEIPADKQNHPVVYVSWEEANAFCAWYSSAAGYVMRLPSEAEWEKAARGADGRIWPWGNEAPTKDRCNFAGNIGGTTPVGAYPQGASPYGVLDMAGNVWEWTLSMWGEDIQKPQYGYPYEAQDGRENIEAPVSVYRILRGGSWSNIDFCVRCAVRVGISPRSRYGNVGFRVISPGF